MIWRLPLDEVMTGVDRANLYSSLTRVIGHQIKITYGGAQVNGKLNSVGIRYARLNGETFLLDKIQSVDFYCNDGRRNGI